MDPALIQTVLLDDADSYSKQPLNDDVFGEAIGGGLLNAEGEAWRWQRRLAAPLFRAEDVLAYVPAFAAACAPVLKRWSEAEPGASQNIDKDMTAANLAGAAGYGFGRQPRRRGPKIHRAGGSEIPCQFDLEGGSDLAPLAALDPASRSPRHGARRQDNERRRRARAGEGAGERG
jgi:cytochrome P450